MSQTDKNTSDKRLTGPVVSNSTSCTSRDEVCLTRPKAAACRRGRRCPEAEAVQATEAAVLPLLTSGAGSSCSSSTGNKYYQNKLNIYILGSKLENKPNILGTILILAP